MLALWCLADVRQAELRLVESDDERVREAASQATWELVRKHTERTAQFTEHVMLRCVVHFVRAALDAMYARSPPPTYSPACDDAATWCCAACP